MKTEPRYYIAYGSNLNVDQMKYRCPDSKIVGTAKIDGWELLFRGSKTGSYLTIEPQDGASVPVVIWKVSEEDEKSLDRYEGFPRFYIKRTFTLKVKDFRTHERYFLTAFAYIMHLGRPLGLPSIYYYRDCEDGYRAFNFSTKVLEQALRRTTELMAKEA